jgi:hypothetical protein
MILLAAIYYNLMVCNCHLSSWDPESFEFLDRYNHPIPCVNLCRNHEYILQNLNWSSIVTQVAYENLKHNVFLTHAFSASSKLPSMLHLSLMH